MAASIGHGRSVLIRRSLNTRAAAARTMRRISCARRSNAAARWRHADGAAGRDQPARMGPSVKLARVVRFVLERVGYATMGAETAFDRFGSGAELQSPAGEMVRRRHVDDSGGDIRHHNRGDSRGVTPLIPTGPEA